MTDVFCQLIKALLRVRWQSRLFDAHALFRQQISVSRGSFFAKELRGW
jgi:hypothetical protein